MVTRRVQPEGHPRAYLIEIEPTTRIRRFHGVPATVWSVNVAGKRGHVSALPGHSVMRLHVGKYTDLGDRLRRDSEARREIEAAIGVNPSQAEWVYF